MREHSQIQKGKGFSLAYALDEAEEGGLSFAARLSDEISGRKMEIYTNQPSFPSILIDETKKYRHITEYRFSLD